MSSSITGSTIENCFNCYCVKCSATVGQQACGNSLQSLCLVTPTYLVLWRNQSDTSAQPTTDGERKLITKLHKTFPKAAEIRVHDISGLYQSEPAEGPPVPRGWGGRGPHVCSGASYYV